MFELAAPICPSPSGGRFAKGPSGNPAGRPKGARNQATLLAERLEEAGLALLEQATGRALEGDAPMLRAFLRYLLPRPGDPTVELDLAPGAERDDDAVFAAPLRAKAAERALRLKLREARAAREGTKRPLPDPPPQAGEGKEAPVSDLYFCVRSPSPAREGGSGRGHCDHVREASAPVSHLYFRRDLCSTAALGSGAARLRPSFDAAI